MTTVVKQADGAVDRFSQSHSLSDLTAALDLLHQISFPKTPNQTLEPDPSTAHSWLKLLSSLDKATSDLKQNLKYPATKIYPPGMNSPQANIPSSAITDPEQRAEYEARLKVNEDRKASASNYSALINQKMKANAHFAAWVQSHYRGNVDARNAILADASALQMSPDRINSIKALVGVPK